MARRRRDVLGSALLLIALLAAVALGFAVVGGAVLLPFGGAVVWVVLGLLVFIGSQVFLFRAIGLHSRADESAEDEQQDGGADWRAWRG